MAILSNLIIHVTGTQKKRSNKQTKKQKKIFKEILGENYQDRQRSKKYMYNFMVN